MSYFFDVFAGDLSEYEVSWSVSVQTNKKHYRISENIVPDRAPGEWRFYIFLFIILSTYYYSSFIIYQLFNYLLIQFVQGGWGWFIAATREASLAKVATLLPQSEHSKATLKVKFSNFVLIQVDKASI